MADGWATEAFRDEVARATDAVLQGEVREGAMTLWQLGLATSDLGFAGGLWNIWGRITDEYTAPAGDPAQGHELAQEAARELQAALGDAQREREFCDRWIYERLDIT